MALVLAKAAPLKPDIKLTEALDDYGKILSDEERKQFYAQGAPDATAAINLATLIDGECNRRRRQCMGPRLITFLESVQQFSGVVDTFVSSHPAIAALVWGGVKIALQIANNFTSYFDRLSTLLMNLGRQCPRIHELGSLYPSNGLQKALCDYYAAIVRLCKHSTQRLRKSGFDRYPAYSRPFEGLLVSFEKEFGPYEREIAQLAQEVKFEASLASKQAQKLESELQARERSEARKRGLVLFQLRDSVHQRNKEDKDLRMEIDRRSLRKRKLQALDSLSTYDYQKTYKQSRKQCVPGTSNWILKNSEFQMWREGAPKGLWCSGKLGSGKTVISACVTASIMEALSPRDVTTFFFCRFDDQESLQARTIIGSIARQLLSDVSADAFRGFHETPVIDFLKSTLSHTRQYFVILDGLDECDEAQIQEVAEVLHSLLNSPQLHFKIFWCSRPNVLNWLPIKFQPQHHVSLDTVESQERIAADIGRFIHNTLQEWLEGDTPELQISDPTLPLTIVDRLEKGAHGMFLWVKLQLLTIREKKSDQQILDTLDHLPRDLPQTFERILANFTDAEDIEIGSRIFRWVAVAKRPLTTMELREAIAIEPLQDTWNTACLINDMTKAVACCGNLVYVEEEDKTLHFTHSSVQQYLRSSTMDRSLSRYCIDLKKADADAGAICVTYLNFPMFNRQMVHASKANITTADITSMVVRESLPAGRLGNKIALSLLRRRDKSSKSVQRLLEEAATDDELSRRNATLDQHLFLSYARQFWLEHTKQRIMPPSGKLWRLWCNLLQEAGWRDTLSNRPWTLKDLESGSENVVVWIAENNHCSLAQVLVTSQRGRNERNLRLLIVFAAVRGYTQLLDICISSKTNISRLFLATGLRLAAHYGHLAIVERLLQEELNVNAAATRDHVMVQGTIIELTAKQQNKADIKAGWNALKAAAGEYGRTALQAAARGGYLEVVERLLQNKADVNAPTSHINGRTALQAAAEGGHLAVVERLLQNKADVNAPASNVNGRTALQAAAEGGYLEVVERLLQNKAYVNAPARGIDGRTALQAAAGGGHLEIVEILLQNKADVNAPARDPYGRTALHAAAEGGYLAVVEKLLQEGADVNSPALLGGLTALQAAAEGGYLEVVERLLHEKAEVNATAEYGWTALQAAASEGHLEVVDRLLQEKVDVNARTGKGLTALDLAAAKGHLAVVERLLQEKISIGEVGLRRAVISGHLEMVDRLLQEEVNVNARDAQGRTLREIAAAKGHLAVVERLRAAGGK